MNKRLLYFICDNKYKDCLLYNLEKFHSLGENKNIETLCISPADFLTSNIPAKHFLILNDFDYKFTAKFMVGRFEKLKSYKSVLYLDCDAIIKKDINPIFDEIEAQPHKIHAMVEGDDINQAGEWHKIGNEIFNKNQPAFNAGIFGFCAEMIYALDPLLDMIAKWRSLAIADQPIFNKYIIEKNIAVGTLNRHCYFHSPISSYKKVNKISLQDAAVVHFLGDAYCGKSVERMRAILS